MFDTENKKTAGKIVDIILICGIVLLCLITVIAMHRTKTKSSREASAVNSGNDVAQSDALSNEAVLINPDKVINEEAVRSDGIDEETHSQQGNDEIKSYIPVFEKPVSGIIIRNFSIEELLYNHTMDDWRIHTGVDISAEPGTDVIACESGVVEFSGYDVERGYCVSVLTGDITCLYASLTSEITLKKGDMVQKGDVVGKTGDSMISEICDEPHLHFEMKVNGEYVNPQEYVEF